MREWDAEQIAQAAGARLASGGAVHGPSGVAIDSRAELEDLLFVGLSGQNVDGGRFAEAALATGAWGVLVGEGWSEVDRSGRPVIVAADPLAAMQRLATAWRHRLGCQVIAITGSTGKTSTKDLTRAMVAQARSVVATSQNLNTEIGLPMTILGAESGTEVLVLELAMRGRGQIAELTEIAAPDVGVIVNVGPVHLELLGSIEAIAATKAELIAGLPAGATIVLPADEPLLADHMRDDLQVVTFGPGGDLDQMPGSIRLPGASAHMRLNALAALAAARAVGVEPDGVIELELSAMRGQRIALAGAVTVINDCYNANPMSMRAALDDLAQTAPGRKIAVLGDMLELGSEELSFHAALGRDATAAEVDVLIAVGPLAAAAADAYQGEAHVVGDAAAAAELVVNVVTGGDTVLVKASRGVGLEVVADRLTEARGDG